MSVQYIRAGSGQYKGNVKCTTEYHEYNGGYHEYTGEISWVHWGISWVHWGISWVHQGDIMINVGQGHWENNWICVETPMYWWSPGILIPTLTMISPSVPMVSSHCTEHSQCSHDITWCNEHPHRRKSSNEILPGVDLQIPLLIE